MATRMQQRRGTAQQWLDADPVLAAGEIGFETDTNEFRIGDGVNVWSDLSPFKNLEDLGGSLDDYVLISTKGQANGVASLDSTGNVPASQLANVLDGAPGALDTLNEIAAALGDDSNFATTIINALDDKAGLGYVNLHHNATTNVHGIADTSVLATQNDISTSVTAALELVADNLGNHSADTTNVHGIANTADLVVSSQIADFATEGYVDSAVSTATTGAIAGNISTAIDTHNLDTTSVHGISDTANLVYSADLSAHTGATTSVHGIADTSALATSSDVSTAVSDHNLDTTNVHGIADTSVLATATTVATAKSEAIDAAAVASENYTDGVVAALTKSSVGLANVDNTSDANKPVSTATQSALDLKANLAGPTFTGTVSLPSTTSIGNVSATELGYVDGVTSAIQTQINSKLALAGGTMTGALTLSGAPTSDLHAATKAYVDNVTAGINFHESVHAASVSNLSANYSNGTSGVGATLTADTNRAFSTLDGESVALGQRVLIKNQTDAKQNGIYTLTTVGSASAPWVLTRATDADNNPTGEMKSGDFTFVQNGTVNASVGYINNSTANPIVIGTDNISYTEFNAGKTVVAGSGLTEATPGTLSIATGGVTSAMIADGAIVDADVNASAAIAQSKISGLTSDLAAKAPLANPTFTGTVTVAANGVAFTDGTQTKAGVPSITTFASAIASSATLAAGEQDKFVPLTGAVTITLPATGYSTGQSIDFYQASGTGAQFASTNSVVGTPGLKFRTTNSVVTAMKTSSGWLVFGDLSA